MRAFLKRQSKPAAMLLKLSIALGTVNALLMIAGAYLLAQAIHNVIFEQYSLAEITYLLWPLAGIILLRAVFLTLSECFSAYAALKIKSAMRQTLLNKLSLLGPSYVEQHGQGATLNTLHNGVEALHDYYAKEPTWRCLQCAYSAGYINRYFSDRLQSWANIFINCAAYSFFYDFSWLKSRSA